MQLEMNHRISLLTEQNAELSRTRCHGGVNTFYLVYLLLVSILGFALYSVYGSQTGSSRGLPRYTKTKAETYQV